MSPATPLQLTTADGRAFAVQSWPLAYWPDGSLKWTGHALSSAPGLAGPFVLTPGANPSATPQVSPGSLICAEEAEAFLIDTGPMRITHSFVYDGDGARDFVRGLGFAFEVLHGDAAAGELRVWLWSPEAGAMDLRRYDETPHGLAINYEDWKPGWGAPLGIANTHDLTFWAFGQMTGPRMLAYAAWKKGDAELGRLAWEKLIGSPGRIPPRSVPQPFTGPGVLRPVTDPAFLGEPVGWQLHGVASVQWALNTIETLEFARRWLPAWEAPAGK